MPRCIHSSGSKQETGRPMATPYGVNPAGRSSDRRADVPQSPPTMAGWRIMGSAEPAPAVIARRPEADVAIPRIGVQSLSFNRPEGRGDCHTSAAALVRNDSFLHQCAHWFAMTLLSATPVGRTGSQRHLFFTPECGLVCDDGRFGCTCKGMMGKAHGCGRGLLLIQVVRSRGSGRGRWGIGRG